MAIESSRRRRVYFKLIEYLVVIGYKLLSRLSKSVLLEKFQIKDSFYVRSY
jgi:hypothetical protein